jgi:hypothetical protein
MQARTLLRRLCLAVVAAPLFWMTALRAQEPPPPPKSSFMPVVPREPFAAVMNQDVGRQGHSRWGSSPCRIRTIGG